VCPRDQAVTLTGVPPDAHVATPGPLATTPVNAARANGGTGASTCRVAAKLLRSQAVPIV